MASYSGVVRKIFPKTNWGSYSFSLTDQKGFFNLGKVEPTFSEGQTISFDGGPGRRPDNVEVISPVKVVDSVVSEVKDYSMAGAKRSVDLLGKDAYWTNREAKDEVTQKRIEIQAARNAAIALLAALGGSGDLSTHDFIDEWTDTFLADNESRLSA